MINAIVTAGIIQAESKLFDSCFSVSFSVIGESFVAFTMSSEIGDDVFSGEVKLLDLLGAGDVKLLDLLGAGDVIMLFGTKLGFIGVPFAVI